MSFFVCAALAVSGRALADRDKERGGEHAREHVDARHGHHHSYLDRGVVVREVPREEFAARLRGERYWFHGGIWYRAQGPRFIVVAPPLGVFVPALPPNYVTLTVGGFPYYCANDAYYVYRDPGRGYEFVAPPPGLPSEAVAAPAPAGSDELYVYPQRGQPPEQQARDRYQCHRWASEQAGFDPTRASGGVPEPQAGAKRADYQRAMQACLDARGYTVC